jgi:hypothetical protein
MDCFRCMPLLPYLYLAIGAQSNGDSAKLPPVGPPASIITKCLAGNISAVRMRFLLADTQKRKTVCDISSLTLQSKLIQRARLSHARSRKHLTSEHLRAPHSLHDAHTITRDTSHERVTSNATCMDIFPSSRFSPLCTHCFQNQLIAGKQENMSAPAGWNFVVPDLS